MNFNDNKTIYTQIADYFLERIISKTYNKGDRIMSVRSLAIELGVNPNTVMRTYSYLQEKDIIFNKRGIGYFIAENALENANKIKYDEFIKDELPKLFKSMTMLNISINDIDKMYVEYLKNNKTNENENK